MCEIFQQENHLAPHWSGPVKSKPDRGSKRHATLKILSYPACVDLRCGGSVGVVGVSSEWPPRARQAPSTVGRTTASAPRSRGSCSRRWPAVSPDCRMILSGGWKVRNRTNKLLNGCHSTRVFKCNPTVTFSLTLLSSYVQLMQNHLFK